MMKEDHFSCFSTWRWDRIFLLMAYLIHRDNAGNPEAFDVIDGFGLKKEDRIESYQDFIRYSFPLYTLLHMRDIL
jgi:hypothetical protein